MPGLALLAAGTALAFAPPLAGVPVAAYVSIALLLVGGITTLPWGVTAVYDRLVPRVADHPLPLLAVERARRVRESAAVSVSGVVAALALAVALTVMVASFRVSVMRWLDVVLPADLYLRTAEGTAAGDTAFLDPALVAAAARVPGVDRISTQRVRALALDPARPPVILIARPLQDPARELPLVDDPLPPAARAQGTADAPVPVYVSEAVADLFGARPGQTFAPLAAALGVPHTSDPRSSGTGSTGTGTGTGARTPQAVTFYVAAIWRDYARQSGSIVIDAGAYQRLTGDPRVNDLLLWLAPQADPLQVQAALRALPEAGGAGESGEGGRLLEFASAQDIRTTSLRIFDRSFAVTYWLQAVAIGIGLFGVAASFSAQVLARRKEFGLLLHLGLTRGQVLGVVAGEGLAWTAIGATAGLALGLAVSVVLVHVVNPQSFHWTMELWVPWLRLAALALAVMVAGTLTAWAAGRAAAGRDMVLAVKEDW